MARKGLKPGDYELREVVILQGQRIRLPGCRVLRSFPIVRPQRGYKLEILAPAGSGIGRPSSLPGRRDNDKSE